MIFFYKKDIHIYGWFYITDVIIYTAIISFIGEKLSNNMNQHEYHTLIFLEVQQEENRFEVEEEQEQRKRQ